MAIVEETYLFGFVMEIFWLQFFFVEFNVTSTIENVEWNVRFIIAIYFSMLF
jgi:hypothetical protein